MWRLAVPALLLAAAAYSCTLDRDGHMATSVGGAGPGGSGGVPAGPSVGGGPSAGGGGGDAGMGGGGTAGAGGTETCGDGAVDGGEQCDDMNMASGDGCSATCQFDAADACPPGTTIDLGATPITIMGDTSTATNGHELGCFQPPTNYVAEGNDVVVAVRPASAGQIVATATATFVMELFANNSCVTMGSAIDCEREEDPGDDARVAFAALAGETYFVIMDGDDSGDDGPFTLTIELAVCGDGIINGDEQCDDMNPTPGDGCNACFIECDQAVGAELTFNSGEPPWSCYQAFFSDPGDFVSWDAARTACTTLGPGWDLAAVTSNGELILIDQGGGGPPNDTRVWLGGNDMAADGTFVWSNGEPWWATPPWTATSPNTTAGNLDDCVSLLAVGSSADDFDDIPCAELHGYVCERPAPGS
jgi:cysteine-rich repeat protein